MADVIVQLSVPSELFACIERIVAMETVSAAMVEAESVESFIVNVVEEYLNDRGLPHDDFSTL